MIKDGQFGGKKCKDEISRETRACNPLCCTRYGDKCDMPFKYNDVTYENCIRDCEEPEDNYGWCPTEKDGSGNGLKWKRCNHDCFLSSEFPNVFASLKGVPLIILIGCKSNVNKMILKYIYDANYRFLVFQVSNQFIYQVSSLRTLKESALMFVTSLWNTSGSVLPVWRIEMEENGVRNESTRAPIPQSNGALAMKGALSPWIKVHIC